MEDLFGERGVRGIVAENARAMGHSVKPELSEGNVLDLAIRGVDLDPLFITSVFVARVQHRRMLVCEVGEIVEAPASKFAETGEMRRDLRARDRRHVKRQQILKAGVEREEILAAAIRGYVVRPLCRCATTGLRCNGRRYRGNPGMFIHSACPPAPIPSPVGVGWQAFRDAL